MSGYLIYHPRRTESQIETLTIYHDSFDGNQDPYLWNTRFLHTYCHITQMTPSVGDSNFWVSGDTFPAFSHLYCDLVFVVAEKVYWRDANAIAPDDPLVDTDEAFHDHYRWVWQHQFKRRRRFTLKADPVCSFQPQDDMHQLIDIVPYLSSVGLSLATLRHGLRSGYQSKPFRLDVHSESLYAWLHQRAPVKLTGDTLPAIRKRDHQLVV